MTDKGCAAAEADREQSVAPGAWAAVAVLFSLYGLAFLDRQIIALPVKPIRHDLGIGDFQISLLQGFSFAPGLAPIRRAAALAAQAKDD